MIEIRPARPEEIPRQKELWKLAFGDEDAYINYFYDHGDLSQVLLLLEDGVVVEKVDVGVLVVKGLLPQLLLPGDLLRPGGANLDHGYPCFPPGGSRRAVVPRRSGGFSPATRRSASPPSGRGSRTPWPSAGPPPPCRPPG